MNKDIKELPDAGTDSVKQHPRGGAIGKWYTHMRTTNQGFPRNPSLVPPPRVPAWQLVVSFIVFYAGLDPGQAPPILWEALKTNIQSFLPFF